MRLEWLCPPELYRKWVSGGWVEVRGSKFNVRGWEYLASVLLRRFTFNIQHFILFSFAVCRFTVADYAHSLVNCFRIRLCGLTGTNKIAVSECIINAGY